MRAPYAGKTIIFGQETQPLQPIREEIKRRGGTKVFYTDGSCADNDQILAQFLAFKGKSVLITSDTNKTARSLQLGDNGGVFQHGATQMIHADMPQNNADLQQRCARISRSGPARRERPFGDQRTETGVASVPVMGGKGTSRRCQRDIDHTQGDWRPLAADDALDGLTGPE